jgi:hypothetical protein
MTIDGLVSCSVGDLLLSECLVCGIMNAGHYSDTLCFYCSPRSLSIVVVLIVLE